jgi:hypothetical protein
MAVCANHIALRNLGKDRLPAPVTKTRGDVEALIAKVVELEDERIELAAVDATTLAKELDKICGALSGERVFSKHGLSDVPLAVLRKMLPFIRRTTRTAARRIPRI